jgi:hypothetical protein
MEPKIQDVRKYALSDEDIHHVVGDSIPIFSYPDLEKMSSIDQAFGGKNRCVLLFPNVSPTVGHWTCMIRRPDSIEFFDPYGSAPDTTQKGGMSRSHLEALDMESPLLTSLMRKSGLPVYYNTYPFQRDRGDVATCGRHCAVRLLYAPYSLDHYKKIIDKSKLCPDDFVSGVSYNKIKK